MNGHIQRLVTNSIHRRATSREVEFHGGLVARVVLDDGESALLIYRSGRPPTAEEAERAAEEIRRALRLLEPAAHYDVTVTGPHVGTRNRHGYRLTWQRVAVQAVIEMDRPF